MDQYRLDLHGEQLLAEYRQQLPLYEQLQQIVMQKLGELIRQSGDNKDHPDNIYGYGVPNFWQAYMKGRSGLRPSE